MPLVCISFHHGYQTFPDINRTLELASAPKYPIIQFIHIRFPCRSQSHMQYSLQYCQNLPRGLLVHHLCLLFLESLSDSFTSCHELLDAAFYTTGFALDEGLGCEVVDAGVEAVGDKVGEHLCGNIRTEFDQLASGMGIVSGILESRNFDRLDPNWCKAVAANRLVRLCRCCRSIQWCFGAHNRFPLLRCASASRLLERWYPPALMGSQELAGWWYRCADLRPWMPWSLSVPFEFGTLFARQL